MKRQRTSLWADTQQFKNVLPAILGSSVGFTMLVIRILYTDETKYSYLVWNVFLAWLAWALGALFIRIVSGSNKQKLTRWGLFFAWLFFLPNTFYLLTDMIHPVLAYEAVPGFNGSDFGSLRDGVMILFDVSLVGLGVWVGWYLGVRSMLSIWKYMSARFRTLTACVAMQTIILAVSYAIYLGRSPRLNSWDVVARPLFFTKTALEPLLHPLSNADAIALTMLFTTLISVVFWSFAPVDKSSSDI